MFTGASGGFLLAGLWPILRLLGQRSGMGRGMFTGLGGQASGARRG